MTEADLEDRVGLALDQGLAELGQSIGPAARDALLEYLRLLAKWNRVYNLTAVREPTAMVSRHLLDCLAVLPWVGQGALLDVGSGAGLPAVPLAIARPRLAVTALDSNSKKARFITQVKVELGLDNLAVTQARVEQRDRPPAFDQVISRAFAEVGRFIAMAGPHCRPGGRLLAMKATLQQDNLAAIGAAGPLADYRLERVETLRVPGIDGPRSLVVVARGYPGAGSG